MMAAARRRKDATEVPLAPPPVSKPRKRFYMQKMPDGVGERAVRVGSSRGGARAQALADFYGSGTVLSPASNQRSMESLLSELLSELDLQEDTLAPELLADAWKRAVGPALADVSALAGVARGRARIMVKHPTVRYEITRLKPQIIRALNQTLGAGSVKSLVLVSV
ncbi:MAG: DUF721 domain-containing protein [Akkermansia sp.]|nr:DUF721 domain-containing protein [Akkermansia sp.]MBR6577022.1 DUF721 domain-containing protein [Akkermansia sp.]